MKILEKNYATFKEFLSEYNDLNNKKSVLESELNKADSEVIENIIKDEISRITKDIEKLENAELYTKKGVKSLEWR